MPLNLSQQRTEIKMRAPGYEYVFLKYRNVLSCSLNVDWYL